MDKCISKEDTTASTTVWTNTQEALVQPISKRTRNLDTHTLIWLDKYTDNCQYHTELRSIVDYVHRMDNVDSCRKYIADSAEQIFLILSNQYGMEIMPRVHHLRQLNSVFIFSEDGRPDEPWIREYPKIRCVCNNFQELKISLQDAVKAFLKQERTAPDFFNTNNKDYTTNSLRNDQWLMKLLYVLIHQQSPANSMKAFVDNLRVYYAGNTGNERILDELSNTYERSKVLWWYTRDTFIYRLLNKVLRQRNVQGICAFHFFIRDLYEQIEYDHQKLKETNHSLRVYRGQIMNNKEIGKLKDASVYNLTLSINPLLSTSLNPDVASRYVEGFKPEGDLRGVLFEIECDLTLTSRPFANISQVSQFEEEQEVLFMPGVAFGVNAIEFNESNQSYTIKLRLNNDQKIHRNYKQNIFSGSYQAIRELFVNISESVLENQSINLDQYYEHIKQFFPSDQLIESDYLKSVGYLEKVTHHYQMALDSYHKSLILKQNVLPPDDEDIGKVFYQIGGLYYQLENYDQAIKYFHDALNCHSLPEWMADEAHFHSAYSYWKRTELNNHDDVRSAIGHLRAGLEIKLASKTLSRWKIGETYRVLASNYEHLGDFEVAINYYMQALEIYQNENFNDECDQIRDEIEEVKRKIELEQAEIEELTYD